MSKSADVTARLAARADKEPMSANAFAALVLSLAPTDRQVRVKVEEPWTGQNQTVVRVYLINLPPGLGGAGGGAEEFNNRALFSVEGFPHSPSEPVAKVKVEQSTSVFHRSHRTDIPSMPFRAKSGPPGVIARYLASYIGEVVAAVPPHFTHTGTLKV